MTSKCLWPFLLLVLVGPVGSAQGSPVNLNTSMNTSDPLIEQPPSHQDEELELRDLMDLESIDQFDDFGNETTQKPENGSTIPEPHNVTDSGDEDDGEPPFRLPRVFCNFNALAEERREKARFLFENADGSYCTDFNFDSAKLEDYHFSSVSHINIVSHHRTVFLPQYIALNDLKIAFPHLRTFLTISESESISFGSVARDYGKRRRFVTSSVNNLRLWGFDGMIVKWLYPDRKTWLTAILSDLRNEFELETRLRVGVFSKLLLGVMLSGQSGIADKNYEVYIVSNLVDFVVLQLFDESPSYTATSITSSTYGNASMGCGASSTNDTAISRTNANLNLNNSVEISGNGSSSNDSSISDTNSTDSANDTSSTDSANDTGSTDSANDTSSTDSANDTSSKKINSTDTSGDFINTVDDSSTNEAGDIKLFILQDTIKEWTSLGADKTKLVIALSLTGQGFILKDASQFGVGAPAVGPIQHISSNIAGEVLFYEMCRLLGTGGTVERLSDQDLTPYWHYKTLWVSYEDTFSLTQKVEYMVNSLILGVMMVSQSEDDFTGLRCDLSPFPASSLVYNTSKTYLPSLVPSGLEHWRSYLNGTPSSRSTLWLIMLTTLTVISFSRLH